MIHVMICLLKHVLGLHVRMIVFRGLYRGPAVWGNYHLISVEPFRGEGGVRGLLLQVRSVGHGNARSSARLSWIGVAEG